VGDVFYFGCWNESGHYLFGPHGGRVESADRDVEHYGDHRHLDGTLAPRRHKRTGAIVWTSMAPKTDRLEYLSEELPQGQFLRHDLDTGLTAIQWWDRTQGDERGACNSTVLARGKRTSAEMLALLAEHFPTVLANLARANVKLVEVHAVTPDATKGT